MFNVLVTRVYLALEYLLHRASGLLRGKTAEVHIPDNLIEEIARCLLPDIVAYCESEEGKQEFAKWQEKRDQENLRKSRTIATEHP